MKVNKKQETLGFDLTTPEDLRNCGAHDSKR